GFQRAAGPQVEQVDQVGGAGDQCTAEEEVQGAGCTAGRSGGPVPGQAGGRGQCGGGDAEEFDRRGGDSALAQGAQVGLQAPGRSGVVGLVVDQSEHGGAGHPEYGTGAGACGRRCSGRCCHGPGGGGQATGEADLLVTVVGPDPVAAVGPARPCQGACG